MPRVVWAASGFLQMLAFYLYLVGVQKVFGLEVTQSHQLVDVFIVVEVHDCQVFEQLVMVLAVHLDHASHG